MCLITDQKEPKVLESDLTVYKVLVVNDGDKELKFPEAIHQTFEYELGKLYQTSMLETEDRTCFDDLDQTMLDENFGTFSMATGKPAFHSYRQSSKLIGIGVGFHSALKQSRLKDSISSNKEIFKCIIPKGSKYYTNVSGLCVSDQLIVVKQI